MTLPVHAQLRDQELIAAAGKGDLAAVERLIREGASVMARDNRSRTALLAAAHGNHPSGFWKAAARASLRILS